MRRGLLAVREMSRATSATAAAAPPPPPPPPLPLPLSSSSPSVCEAAGELALLPTFEPVLGDSKFAPGEEKRAVLARFQARAVEEAAARQELGALD